MASACDNIITDWKRLWQLVSGIHYETPEDTVKEKLFDISKELTDGILQFKKSKSSDLDLEKMLKDKCQEKLYPFTKKLQELLDLESKQCWEVLCYYLTNEYRGSANKLTAFISIDGNMNKLLDDIWGYYSLERMIVLKIVKNLLEFHKTSTHPYSNEYKSVLDRITLQKLKASYLNQLEYLINEDPPNKLLSGEFGNNHTKLVAWSERNSREIKEILHILILIVHNIGVTSKEVGTLFACFKTHTFGKHQRYLQLSNEFHKQLISQIAYSEIVLFLKCIHSTEGEVDSTWFNEIVKVLDHDIFGLSNSPENGPIFLSWMVFNIRGRKNEDNDAALAKYRQIGTRAVHLNVFEFLRDIVAHDMFKDASLASQVARKVVYQELNYLCDLFDADGSIANHKFVYELLCELISWKEIAQEFCNSENGARSLYDTTLENFPQCFVHLSMIASGLAQGGMSEYIRKELEELPIYSELYDDSKFTLESSQGDYVLMNDYVPFKRIDFTIPKGTSVTCMPTSCEFMCHFRVKVNYFNVLHNEINLLLTEAVQYSEVDQNRLKRVNAGIKYLKTAVSIFKTPNEISVEMVHPIELCIDILHKFKMLQHPPIELFANCLNVCSALLPLVENEICSRVVNLSILPFVTSVTLDYKSYAHGVCFDSSLVGTYLVDIEKKVEKYGFLLAYLHFLRTYAKLETNRLFQMEIPGLIFLLREVFPHLNSWRFQSQHEKNQIFSEIMGFICDIVHKAESYKDLKSNNYQILSDVCIYSLLNLENGIVLLRFLALGNPIMQLSMEIESNWMLLSSSSIMTLVRYSMRILMQILRLKKCVYEETALSPLEQLIYTQPKQRDQLRIIPVVTSYMSNIFDRWLPILSCRLLKRIALEFNMSLLACLDMEPDQIRLTFLEKLPDDLESDDLKIAVLELVEACIDKQPGMTEAFFEVNFEKKNCFLLKTKQTNISDSILTFMEDYLEAVKETPNVIENQLPIRIMSIFHSLWKNSMQSLVRKLIEKPTFWPSLCNPLFASDLNEKNARCFSQLLNIIGIEIFCSSSKMSNDLKEILNKFVGGPYYGKWIDYVFNMPKVTMANIVVDETPEWLSRLQSFKDFTVILLKQNSNNVEIPQKNLKLLAEKCLKALVDRSENCDDLRPFIVLSEFYLIIILSFKHSYTENEEEDKQMLDQIIKMLGNVANCHRDLHIRAKEACLTITIKITQLLAAELIKDISVTFSFLFSVADLICNELNNLENSVKVEIKQNLSNEYAHTKSLVLCLNLLKTISGIFSQDGPSNWFLPFGSNKIINRLLNCTSWVLHLHSKCNLTIELLDVLIVCAKCNSKEFLNSDIGDYLWLKLLPPKQLMQASFELESIDSGWTDKQWWPIYYRGIELVTILLEEHGQAFLSSALNFVGIHEIFLANAMRLEKKPLKPHGMVLVKTAVTLIWKLVSYEKEWRLEKSSSLFTLMNHIQRLLREAMLLFNQHDSLKDLISNNFCLDRNNDVENDELVESLNDLIEIMILCMKCMLQFSPKLLDLICEPEFLVGKWQPLFEIHFGAPKLDDYYEVHLHYSNALGIIAMFTKILNLQNYGFHEVPLNNLKIPAPTEDQRRAESSQNTTSTTPKRTFSKSMSTTSFSSLTVHQSANEILLNLDGELCVMALEHILTLIASQSLLALKSPDLTPRKKSLIRRDISSELITYHEFVRKKVLVDFREYKEIWHRRKHGIVMMSVTSNEDNDDPSNGTPKRGKKIVDCLKSLRVNVVRRLHLKQTKQTPSASESGSRALNMTQKFSPIGTPSNNRPDCGQPTISTPKTGQQPIECITFDDEDDDNNDDDGEDDDEDDDDPTKKARVEDDSEEIEYFKNEEPQYSPLSHIQFVEEDYFHFMSNLFTVISQTE